MVRHCGDDGSGNVVAVGTGRQMARLGDFDSVTGNAVERVGHVTSPRHITLLKMCQDNHLSSV